MSLSNIARCWIIFLENSVSKGLINVVVPALATYFEVKIGKCSKKYMNDAIELLKVMVKSKELPEYSTILNRLRNDCVLSYISIHREIGEIYYFYVK